MITARKRTLDFKAGRTIGTIEFVNGKFYRARIEIESSGRGRWELWVMDVDDLLALASLTSEMALAVEPDD